MPKYGVLVPLLISLENVLYCESRQQATLIINWPSRSDIIATKQENFRSWRHRGRMGELHVDCKMDCTKVKQVTLYVLMNSFISSDTTNFEWFIVQG